MVGAAVLVAILGGLIAGETVATFDLAAGA